MPWIVLAVVLCVLVWYWPRHTLAGIAALAVLGVGVAAALWGYSAYREHEKNLVAIRVEPPGGVASESGHPCAENELLLAVSNGTDKVVVGVRYSLSAFRQGRSSNLAKGNWADDDHIVVPHETVSFCRVRPELVRDSSSGPLTWKASLINVRFAD